MRDAAAQAERPQKVVQASCLFKEVEQQAGYLPYYLSFSTTGGVDSKNPLVEPRIDSEDREDRLDPPKSEYGGPSRSSLPKFATKQALLYLPEANKFSTRAII